MRHVTRSGAAPLLAVSVGAARSSAKPTPSRAVVATGIAPREALASLRISFGILNRSEEVDRFLAVLPELVRREQAATA